MFTFLLQGYVRFHTLYGSHWPVILISHNTAALPVSVPFLYFPRKRDQHEQWASYLQVGEPTVGSNRCTVMSCVEPPRSLWRLRLSPTIRSIDYRNIIQPSPSLGTAVSPVRLCTASIPLSLWEVIQHNPWLNVERVQSLGAFYSVGTIVKGNNSSRGVHRISRNLSCSFIRFQLRPLPNPPSPTPY